MLRVRPAIPPARIRGHLMLSNVQITVAGNKATIVVDLSKNLGPSKSGKTVLVATTAGNVTIPGTEVTLGLNAYRKAGA
jgi:hypothetical protein